MNEFLFEHGGVWFSVPALVGTLFFAIRIVMAMMGIDFGDGADGGDTGGPGLDEVVDHAESTTVFKFLSIQTITAFAMGFGWGGLLGLRTFGFGLPESIGVGVVLGVLFAWFVIWSFSLIYSLESSGNISIRDAVNTEGIVSLRIPNSGTGKVRLTIRDRQRAFQAVTEGDEIPAGSRVRVTKVNSDQTVTVVKA